MIVVAGYGGCRAVVFVGTSAEVVDRVLRRGKLVGWNVDVDVFETGQVGCSGVAN